MLITVCCVGVHPLATHAAEKPDATQPVPESPPLSPADSLKQARIWPGYKLELVAAEPLVRDPVAIDWGPDGRIWLAEMADYPYGMDGQGAAGGRIRFLRDTNDDGRYDQSVVFLDGLSFPTAVMAWRDGILVTAAPRLIFARDTDGDGRADEQRDLFRGFMEGNQQLRVNGLRWGLDNWVYCANGGHHAGFGAGNSIQAVLTGQSIALGSRDFRFRPDTGELDPQSGPSQFGRVRDDWGNWFGVQNSHPLWHYVLHDHYLRRNEWVPTPDPRQQLRPPANPRVYPAKSVQKRYHSFENAGHYTSACGPCIYRDGQLFADSVTHAFSCEPFHNLVQHHELFDEGVSFVGRRAPTDEATDFFASADRWCRPVMARTGPDGALWIVDMYRYMIEHPDWLPPEGREELKPFYRAGESRGRIYRIYRADQEPPRIPIVAGKTDDQLIELIKSTNGPVRDAVQKELVWKHRNGSVAQLKALAAEHPEPRVRLQCLATLDGLQALDDDVLEDGLRDEAWQIQCHTLRLIDQRHEVSERLIRRVTQLVQHSHPKVRLQLALSLGELADRRAGEALATIASTSLDPFTQAAVISSMPTHYQQMVDHALTTPELDPAMWKALLLVGMQTPKELGRLVDSFVPPVNTAPQPKQLRLCALWLETLEVRQTSFQEQAVHAPATLGAALQRLPSLFDAAWRLAREPEQLVSTRTLALRLVQHDERNVGQTRKMLAQMLGPQEPQAVQTAAARALGHQVDEQSAATLLQDWTSHSPQLRQTIADLLLASSTGIRALLTEIESGRMSIRDLDAARRERLTQHPNKELARQASTLFARVTPSNRAAVVERYQHVADLPGDVTRGSELFKKHCAACHGEKDPMGPSLRSLTDRSSTRLITAILDPSQTVDPQYLGYQFELKTGEIVYGLIVGESAHSIELRQTDGQRRRLLRSSIESQASSQMSFMPNGLELELNPQDLADVIGYVRSLPASLGEQVRHEDSPATP